MLSLQDDRFDGRIVPVVNQQRDHAELSRTLTELQMIDFQVDFDAGCRELLRIWGIGYVPNNTS